MKIFRNDEGQMLVFTALSMTILFGFLAISVEVGMFFRQKRYLQTAADAAATAAALDYYYNSAVLGTNAQTHAANEAKAAATANGFTDGTDGTSVSVSCGPQYGPNASAKCLGYFEVIITKTSSSPFMSAFSDMSSSKAGLKSFKVGARAVAGSPTPSNNCGWLVNSSASGELTMQGGKNSQLTANGCSIYLNSNSSNAVSLTGNPNITLDDLNLLSSQNVTKGINKLTGTINNNVSPQSPPINPDFKGAVPPTDCNVTYSGSTTITSSYTPAGAGSSSATAPLVVCFPQAMTISGGSQASPIKFAGLAYSGSGDTSTSFGVIYVFENGLTINTGAWVNFGSGTYTAPSGTQTVGTFSNTSGATVDIQGGAFNILSGQANMSIYGPTTGAYNGIALMQPYTNTSSSTSDSNCKGVTSCLSVQFGSANTVIDGMIFAPNSSLVMHDAGGGVSATGFIAGTMNIASSSLTMNNYSEANPYTTPLKMVTLTE